MVLIAMIYYGKEVQNKISKGKSAWGKILEKLDSIPMTLSW